MARAVLAVSVLALVLSPSAFAARAASPPPATPGLLSIGGYERTLVQLERGSLAAEGGTLVSPSQRIWVLPTRAAQRVLPGLLARGAVQAVEPDQPIELARATVDPLVGHEYWRALVGADAVTPPGPGKAVTVIDTGLDLLHEEFAGRPNTVPLGPQNLLESVEDFHGTAVSSVVAAPENGLGIVGVYPQAVLRSVDVGTLAVANVIAALNTAITAGPSVINMSFGVRGSALLADTLLRAFRTGSILVASSGNERQAGMPAGPPGSLPHVLTVAGDRPAERSCRVLDAVARRRSRSSGSRHPRRHPALLRSERLRRALRHELLGAARRGRDRLGLDGSADAGQHADLRAHARDGDRRRERGLRPRHRLRRAQHPERADHAGSVQGPERAERRHPPGAGARPLPRGGRADHRARTGPARRLRARLDVTEDPEDVYRVFVPAGRTVRITVTHDTDVDVDVWKSTASTVFLRGVARTRNILASSGRNGRAAERVSVRNRTKRGFYAYLDVFLPRDGPLDARYTVTISTVRP